MTTFIKAAVIIKDKNKFLLVRENGSRVRGLWNWPQGRVEEGETIEQTAIREAKEETGFDIKIERKITLLTKTFPDTAELHVYLGVVIGGKLMFPVNEIMEANFFDVQEIEAIKGKFVGPWVYELISNL